jgi:predicted phage terminase large subunit-like protein
MQTLPSLCLSEGDLLIFEEYANRFKAESSLHEFARQAWPHIEGEEEFVDGWHIGAICEHLEALTLRQIRNLMIHIPPRTCKSSLVAVLWPAWVWINKPGEQFLYASYAASLSHRDSLKCRRLIKSDWYQDRWGERYALVGDQDTKSRFENDKKGYRLATSVAGSATGEGGSAIIVDDGNNAKDGESDTKREGTNDWWSQVWSTRLNNKKTGIRVVVQQRLHEMDLSGYILNNDVDNKWTRLILPMEFEEKRRSKTIILPSTNGKSWQDPRKKEGDLLWPERIGPQELKELKTDLKSAYNIAGQFQQRPAPETGGIIQKSWFKWWKEPKPPKIIKTIQSWDTALEAGEMNAYSACTTWGYFYDVNKIPCIILLSLWRGRIEYPELRALVKNLFEDYRDDGTVDITADGHHSTDMLLIEAKASGASLIQDLRRSGVNATKFDPTPHGDKLQRVRIASSYIQEGQVFVPAMPPNYLSLRPSAQTLVELSSVFPNSEARDVVDTMTQVILRLSSSGYLSHRKDPKEMPLDTSAKHGFYDPHHI